MSRAIELLLADQANTKRDYKADWKENSKLDFILEEELDTQDISVEEDSSVASIAKFNSTDMYFGTGNKADHYLVATNETQGLEVAVKVHKRGAPGYALAVSETEDGFYEYEVPAEPLATVTGPDKKRAKWNYAFSIATGLNDVASSLSDFVFEMIVDFDPADGEGQTESIRLRFGNGNWTDVKTGKVILVADAAVKTKGGNTKLIEQNVFNIGYTTLDAFRPLNIDPFWAEKEGFYNFTLQATLGGKVVLENKIKVHTDTEFTWTV